MHLKRYHSQTVREALSMARAELGPDALVLSTRLVPAPGWRGVMGHRVVEVTAAAKRELSESRPLRAPRSQPALAPAQVPSDTRPAPGEPASDGADTVVAKLCAAGIDRALAIDVAERLPRSQRRHASVDVLRRAVADQLGPLAAGDDAFAPTEVFVGPPGVGKTTTIAKIAAQERARRGTRIGLVSADGFRVGAVEQLRLYADIIGARFGAARSPAELDRLLSELKGPVLVDTAGRSAAERPSRDLLDLLAVRPGIRTHVVLSAATPPRQAARLLDAYAVATPSRVALTRLDEADAIGPLIALLRDRQLPVSFLGTGQRVPEDLLRATASVLSAYLVGEGDSSRGPQA